MIGSSTVTVVELTVVVVPLTVRLPPIVTAPAKVAARSLVKVIAVVMDPAALRGAKTSVPPLMPSFVALISARIGPLVPPS